MELKEHLQRALIAFPRSFLIEASSSLAFTTYHVHKVIQEIEEGGFRTLG